MIAVLFSDLVASFPLGPVALIVVLVFLGVFLLGLEFFIIPGFGAGGILGFVSLISAAMVAGTSYGAAWGVFVFVLSAMISFVGLLWGMKTNLIQKRFVLSVVQKKGQGTGAEDLSVLVGQKGTSVTDLRPAGAAQIKNRRVDVISDGNFIDKNTPVVVILVEGPRVVVKKDKQ